MSGPSVKVPVDWLDSFDTERLGADGAMFMLSALGWSAHQLTNGVVPTQALRKLWPVPDVKEVIDRLTEAGEVEVREEGLLFVRWHDFILAKSEVLEIRQQNAARQERYRRHQRGDHSLCERCNAIRNGTSNGVTASVSNGHPTRSAPTRPDPTEGRGSERAVGEVPHSAGAPHGTRPGGGEPTPSSPTRGTRGSQEPVAPPEDPEQRLGMPRHARVPGCCPFESYPDHPIHRVAA